MDLKGRLQSTLGDTYSLERELGGGGMSRVFLATETALGRNVVIKVLSGNVVADISAERFAREVKLAASLQHPNIVPVLTTGVADGVPYYTMPYVKGESLRARMRELGTIPRRQAISILRDVARALQYAHSEGVVHRDIKPDNVLLSGDAAVVTDFGIAKAISAARGGDSGASLPETLTREGSTLGTPQYMAPEQVAGDAVDQRTDLYAWGLIAYELLASNHPFAGKLNIAQLLSAQLTENPAPLGATASSIPISISDLVMRCLEKDRDKRPASATEILDALEVTHETHDRPLLPSPTRKRSNVLPIGIAVAALLAVGAYAAIAKRTSARASTSIKSVAVLPFADDGADSANAYFGEGIADELMTELAKVPGLRVASRTSAIALGRRKDLDVREIGRQLGVATVVEGTVRRAGGRLRVTAQLTNANDGLTMWSDAFERENKDVFAVQDDITRAIVTALRPELSVDAQLASARKGPGTSDTEAYDLYLRGLYLVERRGPGVQKAADYFSQAVAKDPNFGRAYASLSAALELFPYFAGVPSHAVDERARATAAKALQLDPTLAEPRVALAMADWHALRWDDADREFKQAIAADSMSAVARTQYGRYLITAARVPEAITQLRVARMLDPLAGTSSVWLSYALDKMGDKNAARAESKRSRELDPNFLNNRTVLVLDIVHDGRFKEALAATGTGTFPTGFSGMAAYNLEMAGDKARAARLRASLDSLPDSTWAVHTGRAWGYLATGDTAKALTELEAAVERREITAQTIPLLDKVYDPVRQSPRFAEIVRRLRLDGRGLTSPGGGRPAP